MRMNPSRSWRRFIPLVAVVVFLAGGLAYWGMARADDQSGLRLPAGVGPVSFPTGTATLTGRDRTVELIVEIAETSEQQQRGLMYRTSLPDDRGMIFAYDRPSTGGFWMRNTLVPLSIAFFNERGVIGDILDMQPCPASELNCPTYTPRNPYVGALEVRLGLFGDKGIREGDSVSFRRDR